VASPSREAHSVHDSSVQMRSSFAAAESAAEIRPYAQTQRIRTAAQVQELEKKRSPCLLCLARLECPPARQDSAKTSPMPGGQRYASASSRYRKRIKEGQAKECL